MTSLALLISVEPVFACSLLHEATPVTRGERFVFVPFLYDQEGERIREANLAKVDIAAA